MRRSDEVLTIPSLIILRLTPYTIGKAYRDIIQLSMYIGWGWE